MQARLVALRRLKLRPPLGIISRPARLHPRLNLVLRCLQHLLQAPSRWRRIKELTTLLQSIRSGQNLLKVRLGFQRVPPCGFCALLSVSILIYVLCVSFTVTVLVCYTRGRGLMFIFARVLVRALVDGPDSQPIDAEDRTLCAARALMPPLGRLTTACESSPRDWTVPLRGPTLQNPTLEAPPLGPHPLGLHPRPSFPRPPKISLFFPSPATSFILSSLSWGPLVEFWLCF